jgi:EAL domain-containing protein (putative c-di-GMP-specific phosphodiesterase class I)
VIATAMIQITDGLHLKAIAEGVETAAQLTVLTALGCGHAQGFLLSRPVSLETLRDLLTRGAGKVWPGLVASS